MAESSYKDLLVEETPDALIATSADRTVLYWNRGAENTFAYSNDEAVGRSFFDLVVPPERLQEERAILERALEGEVATYESFRRKRDGSPVYVSSSTRAIRDAEGRVKCMVTSEKDITHLKALRDATLVQASYRDLLESTPDAIVIVNDTGRIVLVNGQCESVFGYQRAELLGEPVEILMPERYRCGRTEGLPNYFAQPFTRLGAGMELHGLRRNGTEFPIEISLSPIVIEGGTLRMSAIRDISGIKKAEQKFRGLLESAPDAIIIVNRKGEIVLVNSQTEKVFGYNRAELLGQTGEILFPEELRKNHRAYLKAFLADPKVGSMDVGSELFGQRKDGGQFPVEISMSPLETEEGTLVSSSIRDISERRRFESSLREASRMKSEFLANMSHELRTPLNGILGFTEFLIDERPGPLNAKQKEYLTDVHNSGSHLLQLINDVLDLAKVEAGKIVLNPQTFSLPKAMEEVCSVVKGIAQNKSVEIEWAVSREVKSVTLDQQKLKQVCYNLLANAVKSTDRGGRVKINARRPEGNWIEIRVTDTGIGIKQEDLKRLFREFEQLEAGTPRRFEGSGLGLALTKKLVEAQGGSVSAQSDYGVGTTFTVRLPVGNMESRAAA
jgi:PAS domain S-box-containing protein